MKNGWQKIDNKEKENIFKFNENYIDFLNEVKTEREAADYIIKRLMDNGFCDIKEVETLKKGDKVFYNNHNKSVYALKLGDNILEGINVIGSHIDSPRLDLKPNPLYEECNQALLKTHYYGGIKKYQWTSIPLSLRGVVVKPSGEIIKINIGEDDEDPIFTITDLLPHLAMKQRELKLEDAIEGENLNLLVGNIPLDEEKDAVKRNIFKLIKEKYNIDEKDFISSELELVPAFTAKSLGFDKSMVAGYGQDDRVCSYMNLEALLNSKDIKKTSVAIFSDKEEIGSYGNTGMKSDAFDNFIIKVLEKTGNNPYLITDIFCNSKMLSADVGASIDPTYKDASDVHNASFLGCGVELNKYTGSRGKSGSSDASAEFVAEIRNIMEKNNIIYQMSELGKVDLGGGGTIAYILANKGMDVIDCGVPILSMHSPYEVSSKLDNYMAYLTYKAFFEN